MGQATPPSRVFLVVADVQKDQAAYNHGGQPYENVSFRFQTLHLLSAFRGLLPPGRLAFQIGMLQGVQVRGKAGVCVNPVLLPPQQDPPETAGAGDGGPALDGCVHDVGLGLPLCSQPAHSRKG